VEVRWLLLLSRFRWQQKGHDDGQGWRIERIVHWEYQREVATTRM